MCKAAAAQAADGKVVGALGRHAPHRAPPEGRDLGIARSDAWRLPGRPRHDIRDRRDFRGASSGVFNLAAPGLLERLLAGYVRHQADEGRRQ